MTRDKRTALASSPLARSLLGNNKMVVAATRDQTLHSGKHGVSGMPTPSSSIPIPPITTDACVLGGMLITGRTTPVFPHGTPRLCSLPPNATQFLRSQYRMQASEPPSPSPPIGTGPVRAALNRFPG